MNINPSVNKNLTEAQLKRYVLQKDAELETDYGYRVNGLKNTTGTGYKLAGYNNLRKFYEGDHWDYVREDGQTQRVFNYCKTIVDNYTAFLAADPPEDDCVPSDPTDDEEWARAAEKEKLLAAIKEDNNFPLVFEEAVQNQSLLGDAFIFGPYIEWVKVGEREIPRIRFKNIKRVENVRLIWSDEDYTEYDGFILHHRVSRRRIEKIYEKQLKERGITLTESPRRTSGGTSSPDLMVDLLIYWDDTYMLVLADNKVIDFQKHDWGFVPGIYIKNTNHPTLPWGISDIEDILDAQQEYNETVADTRGKIKQVSIPHIFYAGEGEPVEYQAGQAQMIKIGENDRIFPDPMGQSTAPFEMHIQRTEADIHKLSMISEIFFGAVPTRLSGRALSVLLQGVQNKVKLKQQRWRVALKKLNANIFRLVELYFEGGEELIQGDYRTEVYFPSTLVRDVTEEINKFNMKIQSLTTTQKNLGIASPKEEQKLMKKEWNDRDLMIEISRNPALRMQLQAQLHQMIANAIRAQQAAQRPILSEAAGGAGRTREETMPMAAPGTAQPSPISPEGALRQQALGL